MYATNGQEGQDVDNTMFTAFWLQDAWKYFLGSDCETEPSPDKSDKSRKEGPWSHQC